jgi:hypothetical protein
MDEELRHEGITVTRGIPANPDVGVVRDAAIASRSSLWVGALSFEDRSLSSLTALEAEGVCLTWGIALDYNTDVRPGEDAERRRMTNWRAMQRVGQAVFRQGIRRVAVNAYAFTDLERLIERELCDGHADYMVLDVTCTTKIHALAAAAALVQVPVSVRWSVAYTVPESYSTITESRESREGWRDVIVAPLGESATLLNESAGRGIILPGHEADRLIVALAELEPPGGIIAVGNTTRRPDLRLLSEVRNRKTLGRLTRLKGADWRRTLVDVEDVGSMRHLVAGEIKRARDSRAPAILFPYGPKLLIFAAAYELARSYSEASWFVYPIPMSYDSSYSEGAEEVLWLTHRPE